MKERAPLRLLLWLTCVFLMPNFSFSQSVANYSVSRTTGISYNSIINTGNSFSSWRNTGAFSEDDNRSEATDIGFDFWYDGVRYTQFSISTNGFIDFSSATNDGGPVCDAYGYCNSYFSESGAATNLALAPFYDDMTTRLGTDPLGTSMKYLTTGTAPNRVLTVEWDAMAVYQNTTPDINFQVKIYESTGVIEFIYETMNRGTNTFSYTVGINAASISINPTTSQLKTQQTANSTSFSNTPQYNLSTMPTSFSMLRFTPPTPTSASGSFTINGITNTGMTLHWPNWATNEIGYVLYYSTDNTTWDFYAQTAANATGLTITGLSPATQYYWRVYAVTEGALGNYLSANATTLTPANVISVKSGRWDVASTWNCNCVPTAGDNVQVRNGHTVTLRAANLTCNDLIIGEGTSGALQFTNGTARTLDINGNLTINAGAVFDVATNSNVTHTLNLHGNLVNNGTLQLAPDNNSFCETYFNKTNGDQTISGSGSTNAFYTLYIDKGSKARTLNVTSTKFSCNADGLKFVSGGTFKFSATGTNSISVFNTVRDIPSNGKIWMNSANGTLTFSASVNLKGDLAIDQGSLIVGDAANEGIVCYGGKLEINGGSVQVAGNFAPADLVSTCSYNQTGGTLTLPTVSSTSTSHYPFGIEVTGSSFSMSGGTIILRREGGTGAQNLGFSTSGATNGTVTGGTLQIGDASTPAGQTFNISPGPSLGSLVLNSANATATLNGSALTLLQHVTLTAGTLNANTRNITLGGNWTVTGGTFTASTGTVTFNGGTQSVTSAGKAFNNLILAGSGNKNLQDNLTVNGNLTINSSLVPVNSGFLCTLGGNFVNNGTFARNSETLLLNGTATQNISGTSTTGLTNLSINKTSGSVTVNGNVNLYKLLTMLSATTLDADGTGGGVLTLLSTGDDPAIDASIATLPTGATITGNVTVQRYIAPEVPGTTRVYRYISSQVSGRSVADWQDDFPVTGTFSDPTTDFPPGSGITSICGKAIIPSSPSLYQYVEANNGTGASDLGWVAYPSSGLASAATLQVGRGYAAFLRDCSSAVTVDVRGPVNQGNINLTPLLSRTINGDAEDGFNLIGNPYPSAIDWNTDAGWTRTGISPVIYIRDNGAGGVYQTYDYTDNTPMLISSGQAFWVRVTGTANFRINEQAKSNSNGTFFRTAPQDKLIISLSDGSVVDRAIVKINPDALPNLDDYDGPKLDNTLFDLSTLTQDGHAMAVNALNEIPCGSTIPLLMKDVTNGTYTLGFDFQGSFKDYQIQLIDNFTGKTTNLEQGKEYSFTVTGQKASKDSRRFSLQLNAGAVIHTDLQMIADENVCQGSNAAATILQSTAGVNYFALLNNVVTSDTVSGNGGTIALQLSTSMLDSGDYDVKIAVRDVCNNQASLNHTSLLRVNAITKPEITPVEQQCAGSRVSLTISNVPEHSTVNWYKNQDDTTPIFTGETFETLPLDATTTFYASIVSGEHCESQKEPVILNVTEYQEAKIFIKGDSLISNFDSGNQWFLNGELIEGATSMKQLAKVSGSYKLLVKVTDQCTTEAELFLVITDDEETIEQSLAVFPNPANDIVFINVSGDFENDLRLLNSQGQQFEKIHLQTGEQPNKSATLDTKVLNAGAYYIQGIQRGKIRVFKLMVVH